MNIRENNFQVSYIQAIDEQYHASVSHFATLPIIYAIKIANDMKIDGKDPNIPRIEGSQLSPILTMIQMK